MNNQKLYNINRLKQMIKIFMGALCIFAVITILLISANIYKCEGTIYEQTQNSAGVTEYKKTEDINAKITYLDFAFGLEHDENDYTFVPVEHDIRFLFLYISQIIAYGLLFFQLFKNDKAKIIMNIITAVLLIGLGIYTFVFFDNYKDDLQLMFDNSIEYLRKVYTNPSDSKATITAIDDFTYPSKINVSMTTLPFLSCGYMIISGILCLVISYLRYLVSKTEHIFKRGK